MAGFEETLPGIFQVYRMKTFILALVMGVALAYADDIGVGSANDFIDEVLESVRRNESGILSRFDPLDLPNEQQMGYKLKNTVMRGLSSIRRSGDCEIEYEGDEVRVTANLAASDVTFESDYKALALFVWLKGHMKGDVEDLSVRMKVVGQGQKVRLEEYKVTRMGRYHIRSITGATSAFDWLRRLMADAMAQLGRRRVVYTMEKVVSIALEDLLENTEMPPLL